MTGFMLAAMLSATESMVSMQLNVFAGVLTNDFYRAWLRPQASQRALVRVGRGMTLVLGAALVCVALSVPFMGGAERIVLSITSMLVVPLLAPSLWGLFSRRIEALEDPVDLRCWDDGRRSVRSPARRTASSRRETLTGRHGARSA